MTSLLLNSVEFDSGFIIVDYDEILERIMRLAGGNQVVPQVALENQVHDKNRRPWWITAGIIGSAALLATSCSSASSTAARKPHNTSLPHRPAASSTPYPGCTPEIPGGACNTNGNSSTSVPRKGITITFDARPGRIPGPLYSDIIDVYFGVKKTLADRQRAGTFKSGQTDVAYCQTIGRQVHTHPGKKYGEQPGISSNMWLGIEGTSPSDIWYATVVYMTDASQNAAFKLPYCPDAP